MELEQRKLVQTNIALAVRMIDRDYDMEDVTSYLNTIIESLE
jgi:hypothetical protein